MYITDLGMGRMNEGVDRTVSANERNDLTRFRSTGKTDNYASVMKRAVDNQKAVAVPTFASAGDIIIQEAFQKMEADPEWEETVMNKIKEYYAGDYAAGSAQGSYLNLAGQNSLQSYLVQSLIGAQGSLGLGVSGYSPYGTSSLASSAYGSVLNSAISSSLFGDWQL